MIKRTCNVAEQARMRKLGKAGYTLPEIAATMKLSLGCVKRNMVGQLAGTGGEIAEVALEVVPAPAVAPAVAPAPPAVDNRSPQQKAADTRKANKAASAAAADAVEVTPDTAPNFLE